MKKLFALLAAVLLLCTITLTALAETKATVTGGWLRLRATPSFDAETLASCPDGTEVTVLSTQAPWYYVRIPNGQTGYMYSAYLKLTTPASNVAYVTSANGRDVRLRSGPGTGYEVIGTYSVGHSLTILSRGDTWYYIQIGAQRGYMMAQYISGGTAEGYTAYITSSNGLNVRLRAGAGTEYSVLGSYSVGTQVTVLEHGAVWDYVTVGSRNGYIMTAFLTTTPPSTNIVTAVTLSSYVPVVGDTLISTVSPASAHVTYLWTNDLGSVLSTGSTYTVAAGQEGRKIRLTVTGTGNTVGSASTSYTATVVGAAQQYTLTGVTINCTTPQVGDVLTANVTPYGAVATIAWYRANGTQIGAGQSYVVQSADVGYRIYCVAIGTGTTTGAVVSSYTAAVVASTSYTSQEQLDLIVDAINK